MLALGLSLLPYAWVMASMQACAFAATYMRVPDEVAWVASVMQTCARQLWQAAASMSQSVETTHSAFALAVQNDVESGYGLFVVTVQAPSAPTTTAPKPMKSLFRMGVRPHLEA